MNTQTRTVRITKIIICCVFLEIALHVTGSVTWVFIVIIFVFSSLNVYARQSKRPIRKPYESYYFISFIIFFFIYIRTEKCVFSYFWKRRFPQRFAYRFLINVYCSEFLRSKTNCFFPLPRSAAKETFPPTSHTQRYTVVRTRLVFTTLPRTDGKKPRRVTMKRPSRTGFVRKFRLSIRRFSVKNARCPVRAFAYIRRGMSGTSEMLGQEERVERSRNSTDKNIFAFRRTRRVVHDTRSRNA